MFSRRPRPRSGDGGLVHRRPKRAKTYHNTGDQVVTAEDEVIKEFQEILGQLRSVGDINGGPVVEYDEQAEVVEAQEQNAQLLAEQHEDALPEADLRSVPPDPSLQALWIARETKKLAVYNEEHSGQKRVKNAYTTPPFSNKVEINGTSYTLTAHEDGLRSVAGPGRSSGRKKRQTDKARNSHLEDLDAEDGSLMIMSANRSPTEGLEMLSALVTNERIHHALSHSLNLGPGNFEKRNMFGIQFLQSMAADTIPPGVGPAAQLKHSLWRSRNNVPIISALHILAGFNEVVEAIDIAFQGRLDWRTPLAKREPFSDNITRPINRLRGGGESLLNGSNHHVDIESNMPSKRTPFLSRTQPDYHNSEASSSLMPFSPEIFPRPPRLLPKVAPSPVVPPRNEREVDENLRVGSDIDDSFEFVPGASRHFTVIDPTRSASAVAALNGATDILEEMAFGALKTFFLPTASGPPNNQYSTPYGLQGPNNYVTPYADPPQGQSHPMNPEPAAFDQPVAASQVLKSSATENLEFHEGVHNSIENSQGQEQVPNRSKGKGKEKEQELPIRPGTVLETTGKGKDTEETTASRPVGSNQQEQEDDEDFTQIDSFLALAAGDDSDSEEEIDRDRTISREMTPTVLSRGDPAVESAVEGIILELATNQNRGHGLGFLNPQTHLYQISNAQRFADGLKTHVDNARLEMNCVVSAAHSRAQQAFYDAVIKRITNPYLEGALPQFSNIVYHKGKAYHAIPGPAHPMFHQQPPYPPPPPPSADMILPSQHSIPPPEAFPPPGFYPFPGHSGPSPYGPSPQFGLPPYPGSPPHSAPLTHSGLSPHSGAPHSAPPPHFGPPPHTGPPPHSAPLPHPDHMPHPGLFPPPGMFAHAGFLPGPGMMHMKLPIDPLRRISVGNGPTRRVRTFRFKQAKSRANSAPFEAMTALQGFQPSAFQRPVFFPSNDGLDSTQPPVGPRKRKRKLQLTQDDLASEMVTSVDPQMPGAL